MARSQETLIPYLVRAIFIRKEPVPQGGAYYHFQASEYLPSSKIEILPQHSIQEIDNWATHVGNIKIKVSASIDSSSSYAFLHSLKPKVEYAVFMASNPRSIVDDKTGRQSGVYEAQVIRACFEAPPKLWKQLDDWIAKARGKAVTNFDTNGHISNESTEETPELQTTTY